MANYQIASGDTLSRIAQRNGTTVQALLQSNPTIKDPNRIYIGQSLVLPGQPAPAPTSTTSVTTSDPAQLGIGNQDPNRPGAMNLPAPYGGTPVIPQAPMANPNLTTAPTTTPGATPTAPGSPAGAPKVPGAAPTPTPAPGAPTAPPADSGVMGGVPPGAVYISDPNELKFLTESQIWRDPTSQRIYRLPGVTDTRGKTTPIVDSTGTPQSLPQDDQKLLDTLMKSGLSFTELEKFIDTTLVPSQEDITKVKTDLGIPELEKGAFEKPSKSSQQMFQEAFDSAGLADIKKQSQELIAEINRKKADLLKAVGAVNDNPWLTEASRVGRLRTLIELANGDIGNLIEQQKQLADLYTQGVTEVNAIVTRNTDDFNTDQARTQAKLNYLLKEAEERLKTKASEKKASSFRYVAENKGVDSSKPAPKVVGSASTGYYAWDAATGKFVQVIGGTGGGSGSAGKGTALSSADTEAITKKLKEHTGDDQFVNPVIYKAVREAVAQTNGTKGLDAFDKAFPADRYLSKTNRDLFGGKTTSPTNAEIQADMDEAAAQAARDAINANQPGTNEYGG